MAISDDMGGVSTMMSAAIAIPTWLTLALAAPFIGSFLGVLVTRLPQGEPVLLGRSRCSKCSHTLGPVDLIPIISWVSFRARCRHCSAVISRFYPMIELGALVIVLWAATVTSGGILIASSILGWMLLTLAVIDWRHFLLPNALTYSLGMTGLGAAYWFDWANFNDHLIGAIAGFVAFTGVARIYRLIRKRDGLGAGDAKLLGALGAWLSWQGLPSVVFIAAALALAAIMARNLGGIRMSAKERLPFGPFLAAGGWLVWLYGPLTPS